MQLVIDSVTKVFDGGPVRTVAMEDVSLEVNAGEFVSVVGPSGCGKSTLLRLVAGLTDVTSGQILLDGKAVDGPVDGVGFVFQSPVLLQWRTVMKNVMFPYEVLRKRGCTTGTKQDYERRARELLHMVGLEEYGDAYPKQLSGGMRMRVSICRALLSDPKLLLMDEPFGALDQLSRERLNVELNSICQSLGHTVLFVTHHVPEAVYLSDRVMVMSPRPGRVAGIVDIDIPHPRPNEARETPESIQEANRVRALLVDEVDARPRASLA